MGTRSTIALEYANGVVEQVYCHWDGYLEHNGELLAKHYSDPFVLQKLINLGNLSILAEAIEPTGPHDFNKAQEGVCVFYGRDRQERNQQAEQYKSFAAYEAHGNSEEYDYVLRNVDGVATWFVRCYATRDRFVELQAEMKAAALAEAGE